MKRLLLLFLACSALHLAAQQPTAVFKLWNNEPPTHNGITAPEKDENGVASNITVPTLSVFVPKQSNGIAVLACPGGGYHCVCHGTEGFPLAQWYLNQGITYAVLKYRLPNGHHEVPLHDVFRAMDILREHQKEYGFQLLGIQGASAGGHLAATASVHYDRPEHRPDFQILFYPVITFNESETHVGSRQNLIGANPTQAIVEHFCLEKQITPQTPPAFIMHSADDKVVPLANSLHYSQALADKGVFHSLHVYPVGGHGWAFHDWFPYKSQWTAELSHWLQQLLLVNRF